MNRRSFLSTATAAASSLFLPRISAQEAAQTAAPLYDISLAEWSLHRAIFSKSGDALNHLDFAKTAASLGIKGVEYVNQMFRDKAKDEAYLNDMKTRAEGEGVKSLLIMCDGEGNLGDPDVARRAQAVENHVKWLEAAAFLGCHSIRVNASSAGSYEEQIKLAADGLRTLAEKADPMNLNVIVENHGGLSSNGIWLTEVMKTADHKRVGILPDFGNFYIDRSKGELYNPYKGVREFMPWAKAVSAKSFDWETGAGEFVTEDRRENIEISIDFLRMMEIVTKAGYHGFVGIEYEGDKHPEIEGITKTRDVLLAVREKLSAKA